MAIQPTVHIYTRSKLPRVTVPNGVPSFEAFYGFKTFWPPESLARFKAAIGR